MLFEYLLGRSKLQETAGPTHEKYARMTLTSYVYKTRKLRKFPAISEVSELVFRASQNGD